MSFKSIQEKLSVLTTKYGEELDVVELLDFSRHYDNPEILCREISRQPAIFAYVANLKKQADEAFDTVEEKVERFKAGKLKTVVEYLKSDGVTHPSSKMIEGKFQEIYEKNELYAELKKQLSINRKRKESMAIVLKAIEMREVSFKSLSYLADTMIKCGIMYPKKSNQKRMQ